MKTSPEGVAEIAGHEGIVLSPYRDSVGIWTFGVGHTRSAGPPDPATMARGVRQPLERALEIFRADLAHFEERVGRAVTVPLEQHEFDALVSFDFNTGGIFRARLTTLLNRGDRAGAAAAFDGWHSPPEIIPRRDREKRLFKDGVYAHGGLATVLTADAAGRVDWGSGTRVNALALLSGDDGTLAPRPDDPGSGTEAPEGEVSKVGTFAVIGAALAAIFAFLGKLALWAAIVAAVGGGFWLLWRHREKIRAFFRRLTRRGA